MSYVTLDHVRPYLIANSPAAEQITDQPARLHGVEFIRFHGAPVAPDSLRVKSRRTDTLARTQIVLASTAVQISSSPIVPNSLVVANNSSLSRIYSENIDYTFDSASGTIAIKPGGELAAGMTVTVWFEPYLLYAEGNDYAVDLDRAELRRLSSGEIGDGETVYLDYSPLYAPFSDDLLNAAITEANGLIEQEIDPTGLFGADPTLVAAALCRALEIICRAAATRELASGRGFERIALSWLKLAEDHSARADNLLRSFHPPLTGPSLPTIS